MEITSLEKVLQFKCQLHPSNQSDILHISAGPVTHRACVQCLINGDIPILAALNLKSLFSMGDNQDCILQNYPPLGDRTIYQRLENIQQYSTGNIIKSIVQQMSDLKRSFDEILSKLQKDSIRQVEELGQQRRQVLDLYQSLCEPNKLKEAVIQASQTKQESMLHEVIVKKCQDSTINTSKLQSVINQFEAKKQKFSMKMVNELAESLRNALLNLSFFTSPISPMLPHSILQEFQLVPSNKSDSASRTVISRKENNQLDALCIQNNGYMCSLNSLNALDNNSYYNFRFAFHQEATEGSPQFIIGLINQNDKDKTTDCNLFRYREYRQDCEINKIIKGVALNSALDAKNVHKEVEMRVHLASRTVKVADFPNYNNVVELTDKTDVKEGCQYCLLVQLGYINNHITLTDVIVSDGFDSSM